MPGRALAFVTDGDNPAVVRHAMSACAAQIALLVDRVRHPTEEFCAGPRVLGMDDRGVRPSG